MYIKCLNGIRGVAIILVILSHSTKVKNLTLPDFFSLESLGLGTIGVRLFFILSGFLITFLLMFELKKNNFISFKNFFIRRLLRIFPAFYFYLFALFFLSYFSIIELNKDAILIAFLYIQNFTTFQNTNWFTSSWLVVHSWSLSVEEQFYIIYPLIFTKFSKIINNKPLLIVIILCLIGTFFRALNYSYPEISRMVLGSFFMHADFLLIGCILAITLDQYKDILQKHLAPYKNILLLTSLIFCLIASSIEYKHGIFIIISGLVILFSNTFIILYFLLFPLSKLGIFMENKTLSYIGKLSYSIYIW